MESMVVFGVDDELEEVEQEGDGGKEPDCDLGFWVSGDVLDAGGLVRLRGIRTRRPSRVVPMRLDIIRARLF